MSSSAPHDPVFNDPAPLDGELGSHGASLYGERLDSGSSRPPALPRGRRRQQRRPFNDDLNHSDDQSQMVDDDEGVEAVARRDGEPAASRYASLIERALAYVRDQGGAVHEDKLIIHVFGNLGHFQLWRPLLREALAPCSDLSMRADGYWTVPSIARVESADSLLSEFVAIDVETTGARPATQRVIEVAAIRFRDSVEVERYETLLCPDRRIPHYISNLTGIRDADVANAPRFERIADALLAFIGTSVICGHNVKFDLAFLDMELRRAKRPIIANDRIDTVGLAIALLPNLRRPNLDNVAKAVGLRPRRIHRAGIDADLCGRVAIHLLDRARDAGIAEVDLVKAVANSSARRPKEKIGRGRAVLDRSLLDDIPKAPGVYLMRDQYDHIIYVGKAKNLRDRVGSYYSQPLGYTRKMDGLIENLSGIETITVGSELEALLLESQLIRRYQPRYNTALRSFEHYPYIRLDLTNPWPRITLAKDRKSDDALYFGPYRNKSGARRTVEVLNDLLPLRTCPRSFRNARSYGSPCLRLDMGKCLGPCVGRADQDEYRALARDVARFLGGDEAALSDRLWRGLEEAAARQDFERAARLRNDLRTVAAVVGSQRTLTEASLAHTLLLIQPGVQTGHREVLLVISGRCWARFQAALGDPADLGDRLERAWGRYQVFGLSPVDHESVDETNILNRWLYRNAGHSAILRLPDADSLDLARWRALAIQALSVPHDELIQDVHLAGPDAAPGDSPLITLTENGGHVLDANHLDESQTKGHHIEGQQENRRNHPWAGTTDGAQVNAEP